jgi:sialic acid synthase SpsE
MFINNLLNDKHVTIIAEACDNHFGDIKIAKEMALLSKLSGADAVKFQHHIPDEEMLRDIPMSSNFTEPLYDFLQKYALSLDDHKELYNYCNSIGIEYLCTPFSYLAAKQINKIGVSAFKIGSGEMTDTPMLEKISNFGKPIIISTGMSTFDEIDRTYNLLSSNNLILMNCTSEYPPVYEDINLGVIGIMKERYPLAKIGHSDHTPDLYTAFAAAALGATVIEKHITLDKKLPGPDQSVSIDMHELKVLVDGIRKISLANGNKKQVNKNESEIRKWAHRSVVSITNIKKGEIITNNMIWSKRPGTGIPSWKMDQVSGKKALVDIPNNSLIKWNEIE